MKRVLVLVLLATACSAMTLAGQLTNTGSDLPAVFEGHVLSGPTDANAILYAPSEADNPTFRADLSALTGAVVDYFDPRAVTPDVSLLLEYDCVMTWVNYAYADPVAMGDNLAEYVDGGGKVILGQWCLIDPSGSGGLHGAIAEPPYCPVTSYFYTSGNYMGDGVECVHDGITAYESSYVDVCTLIEGNFSDGTMSHGGVATAWRPDMMVWYSPGNTGGTYGTGDWVQLTANMFNCSIGPLMPLVDITCNGLSSPVTIISPDPVTLDIEVDPRNAVGAPVDVWAIVKRGPGCAVYDGSGPMMGWTFPVSYPFTGHALASGPLVSISSTILNTALPPGSYTGFVVIDPLANNRYNATAHNIMDSVEFTVIPAGTEIVLIWNPSGSSSGQAMADAISALGVGYELETGALPADLGLYAAVFVDLGIFGNNYVLSAGEGTIISTYLDGGGNVFLEGGDTWAYDAPTAAHPYFGITGLSDGSSDTYNCDGAAGTFTEGMTFAYSGNNSWMDQLDPVAPAYTIFTEQTAGYVNGIAHDGGTYKTIGASFEFGGLDDGAAPSTKSALMQQYLDFFGLTD